MTVACEAATRIAMGVLDQFAKLTFEEETEIVTKGGAVWCMPPELGLSDVRLDGMLLVRDRARLATLAAPWSQVTEADEVCLEVKMVGDHVDLAKLERALLRRQARQVQRVEDETARWNGQEPLWVVASHVPGFLKQHRTVVRIAPGCYRVDPASFQFLWIAANQLPLREELIPFLVARSGRALDEFALWLTTLTPRAWMVDVVRFLPMTTAVRDNLLRWIEGDDDPAQRERDRWLAERLIDRAPELKAKLAAEGRLVEARRMLARVFARRKLVPNAEEQARIDACTDLQALECWVDQSFDASTVAEALR